MRDEPARADGRGVGALGGAAGHGHGQGPDSERIEVWQVDVVALLAAVDRLAQEREPAVQVRGQAAGAYISPPHLTCFSGATVHVGRLPGVTGE